METIKNNPQEQAIIGIIQDAIIWNRVSNKMYEMINAFHPQKSEEDLNLEDRYKGYNNALNAMGLKDNVDLCDKLSTIFWNSITFPEKSEDRADKLAESIYIDWLLCMKNHCSTLKTVA